MDQPTQIGRRGFLRGTLIGGVGLATAAVIGCDDDDDDDEGGAGASTEPTAAPTGTPGAGGSPATSEPTTTGSMRMSRPAPPPTLDPNSSVLTSPTYHAIYDALTRVLPAEAGSVVAPGLAESWETDPSDPTTWIFHLREAEWSDGTPFSADDVAFSFEYFLNPDNKSRMISRVGTVAGARVIDPRTVAIQTSGTDPILPRRNGLPFIIPQHIFTDPSIDANEQQGSNPVGTGAYVVADYLSASSVKLTKNPSGWRGTQGMDEVDVIWIGETTTRLSAFETGDVDFITNVPANEGGRVEGFTGTTLAQPPAIGVFQWIFNNRQEEGHPTNDGRVRKALNYALDKQALSDVIWNGVSPVARDQMVPRAVFGHDPSVEPLDYDPDEARALLSEAGFADGFDMTVEARFDASPEIKPATEGTAGFWSDIGVSPSIIPIETNVWRDRLYGRETKPWPGAWQTTFTAQIFDASQQMVWYLSTNAMSAWENRQFDEAFNAAQEELDEEAREQLFHDAVAAMRSANEGPSAFLVEDALLYAYRADRIANYTPWPLPEIHFDSVRPA